MDNQFTNSVDKCKDFYMEEIYMEQLSEQVNLIYVEEI